MTGCFFVGILKVYILKMSSYCMIYLYLYIIDHIDRYHQCLVIDYSFIQKIVARFSHYFYLQKKG